MPPPHFSRGLLIIDLQPMLTASILRLDEATCIILFNGYKIFEFEYLKSVKNVTEVLLYLKSLNSLEKSFYRISWMFKFLEEKSNNQFQVLSK